MPLNVWQRANSYVLQARQVTLWREADAKTSIDFSNQVGWQRKDAWVDYNHLIFAKDAPEGQLPFFVFFEQVWRVKILGVWEWHSAIATAGWWRLCLCLFSRVESCQR